MPTRNLFALALSGLVLLGACAEDKTNVDETVRDESGEVTDGGDVGVLALQPGDCIVSEAAVSADGGEVDSTEAVPCDQPHDAQVYSLATITQNADSDDFPGSAALTDHIFEQCEAGWTDAIGTVFEDDPDHDLSWLEPTEFSWEETDDRGLICMVVAIDGSKLTTDLVN